MDNLRNNLRTLLTSDTTYLIPPEVDTVEWYIDNIIGLARHQFADVTRLEIIDHTECKKCNGTGMEICDNPDHNFIASPLGAVGSGDIGRIGCPSCGHDEQHRIPNTTCYVCKGSGVPGRTVVFNDDQIYVKPSFQDDDKTLKLFIDTRLDPFNKDDTDYRKEHRTCQTN